MAKSVARFRRKRLQRLFVGEHGPSRTVPSWVEIGHLLQGAEIMLKRVVEFDGNGNVAERNCGWDADGTLEPAQNTIADYRQYVNLLTGKRPIAILTGDDQLWRFDYQIVDSKTVIDNRISVVTDIGYKSPRNAAATKVTGWTPGFQVIQVKNFTHSSGRMSYQAGPTLFLEYDSSKITIGI
jgi:hypothetical protein